MSISVNQLTKIYGSQIAVNNVSFTVNKGEIVGFLGPNGAGKSTTMKILTGYIQGNGGSAYLDEEEIRIDNVNTKKKIGYLPEHNPLYPEMYIKEYLQFVGSLYGLKKGDLNDRIEEIIEKVGLSPEKNKKIENNDFYLAKSY